MTATALALTLATLLVAIAALRTYSEHLNLRALEAALPAEFEDHYDEEAYATSRRYAATCTRFDWIARGFDLVVLLAFWGLGGFAWLDEWTRALGLGLLPTGLLYIGVLVAAEAVIELPFELYSTFSIEERFGFNKTDWRTFALDRIKGAALGLLLGAPILALILLFFEWAGPLAWLYAWGGVTLISLVVSFVAPTWIMPLFNDFTPLEDGALKSEILAYAQRVGFPLANVFVIDGSKRSTKSNAFFTGFGKNRRIALFDTLVAQHSVPELVTVMAHEIGHYKKRHIFQTIVLSIVHFGVLFYLLSLALESPTLFAAFGVDTPSAHVGLIVFSLLYAPISFLLSIALNALSRKNEFEADRYAVETTGQGEELALALKKLSRTNLGSLTPHPLHVFLTYSHPPVLDRIAAIRAAGGG